MLLRWYETAFIVRPDVSDDAINKLHERVVEIISAHSGQEVKFENWGKRKLAYGVAKNAKGVYLYVQFLADNRGVQELERNLRIHDLVLQYMTVVLAEDIDPASFNFEVEQAKGLSLITKSGDTDRRRRDREPRRDRDGRDGDRRFRDDDDDMDDDGGSLGDDADDTDE